jgi:hypothetical protein
MRIGDAAEGLFDSWATQVPFGNEPFYRDRHGIDRWIELPSVESDTPPSVGTDALPPNVHAYVQVKGTLNAKRACDINLANWKRLIELNEPCFVVGFVLDRSLRPSRAHVIHVDERLGARILTALRQHDASSRSQLHRKILAIQWSEESALAAPDGERFVERIRELVGDPRTYAARKATWREQIGYPERPHRITVRFHATDEEIALASVGDGRLEANVVSHTDVRFDIERPVVNGLPPGRVWVQFGQGSGVDAELRVRGITSAVTLRGQAILPITSQRLPPSRRFLRFKSGGLSLDFVGEGFGTLVARHEGLHSPTTPRTLRDLAQASTLVSLLEREGGCDVELHVAESVYSLRSQKPRVPRERSDPFLVELGVFEWAIHVAREVGIFDDTRVVPARLLAQGRQFLIWAAALGVAQEDVQLGIEVNDGGDPYWIAILCNVCFADRTAIQCFAVQDPTPERGKDGRLYYRMRLGEKCAPKILLNSELSECDPQRFIDSFVARFPSTRSTYVPSSESLQEQWYAHVKQCAEWDQPPLLVAPRGAAVRARRHQRRKGFSR